MKIHFIVGMSRSGTTWIAKSLNLHSQISAFGETSFFGRDNLNKEKYNLKDLNVLLKKYKNIGLNDGYLDKVHLTSTIVCNRLKELINKYTIPINRKEVFVSICESISSATNKEIIIEKTPHHINHIKQISSYFPNSKIICCCRDAFGFMLSYKHQGDRKNLKTKKHLKRLYHPLGCLIIYKKYEKSISKLSENNNIIKIDVFENEKNNIQTLDILQTFLNVNNLEKINLKKYNSSFRDKHVKPELNNIEISWLKLFGYDKSNLKFNDLFNIFKSSLSIPIWAFNTILILKSKNSTYFNVLRYLYKLIK